MPLVTVHVRVNVWLLPVIVSEPEAKASNAASDV